jgi:hypothetical protein
MNWQDLIEALSLGTEKDGNCIRHSSEKVGRGYTCYICIDKKKKAIALLRAIALSGNDKSQLALQIYTVMLLEQIRA